MKAKFSDFIAANRQFFNVGGSQYDTTTYEVKDDFEVTFNNTDVVFISVARDGDGGLSVAMASNGEDDGWAVETDDNEIGQWHVYRVTRKQLV